ncbi:MAG: undecaprenyl/decaprenyl-phosphate alpha-N-acetylglucosaminyl 1-phosphate transferase [Alphaproteobacteria bacterium]|nr:undecaprenyl/decaprenyl-phosphate alpha-N-acetylglucosaminyl 1-phosphate transferase [Alphaproteobacteria bacterium]
MIIAIALYSLVIAAIAGAGAWLMARNRVLMDEPNERSSHVVPTARGGGVGIVVASLLGFLALGIHGHPTVIRDPGFLGVLLGALIAAAGGLADDVRSRSYSFKLGFQVAAAALAMACGLTIDRLYFPGIGPLALGWFAPALTLLWLVGLTNAYNFMDGIDGLAAGTAVVAAGFLTVALIVLGQIDVGSVASTLAAASLGFLLLNLPPARVFMGDVGSQFIGFALAALAILMAREDPTGTLIYVVPLLLFHFVFDTLFTAFRRWRAGEDVTAAHRTHLYQRLTHAGFGHGRATLALCAIGVAQGLGALWLVQNQPALRLAIFVPALALQIVYALAVTRYEQRVIE